MVANIAKTKIELLKNRSVTDRLNKVYSLKSTESQLPEELIAMQALSIIDYVVVHEMCHLKYHDHSPKYWELLGSIIPDWRERKEWLRVNGGMLEI